MERVFGNLGVRNLTDIDTGDLPGESVLESKSDARADFEALSQELATEYQALEMGVLNEEFTLQDIVEYFAWRINQGVDILAAKKHRKKNRPPR